MDACFRCGLRYRPRRTSKAEARIARALSEPLLRRRSAPARCPVPKPELLRPRACCGPDGQERYALLINGQRIPIVVPGLATALASKTTLEPGRGAVPTPPYLAAGCSDAQFARSRLSASPSSYVHQSTRAARWETGVTNTLRTSALSAFLIKRFGGRAHFLTSGGTTSRHGEESLFRAKASLAVKVSGPKRGARYDFEARVGGDPQVSPAHLRCEPMLGHACVMRLTPSDKVTQGLGLAEGIRTRLAMMQRASLGPVLAANFAGGVARFRLKVVSIVPPPGGARPLPSALPVAVTQ